MTKSIILPQLDVWEQYLLLLSDDGTEWADAFSRGQIVGKLSMIGVIRRMFSGATLLPPEVRECKNTGLSQ